MLLQSSNLKKRHMLQSGTVLLQSGTATWCYKVEQGLLQSGTAFFITKWDNFITKWDGYY